jgi:hypothetical protein
MRTITRSAIKKQVGRAAAARIKPLVDALDVFYDSQDHFAQWGTHPIADTRKRNQKVVFDDVVGHERCDVFFDAAVTKKQKRDFLTEAFYLAVALRSPENIRYEAATAEYRDSAMKIVSAGSDYFDQGDGFDAHEKLSDNYSKTESLRARNRLRMVKELCDAFDGTTLVKAFVLTCGYEYADVLSLSADEVEAYYAITASSPTQLSWDLLVQCVELGIDSSMASSLISGATR